MGRKKANNKNKKDNGKSSGPSIGDGNGNNNDNGYTNDNGNTSGTIWVDPSVVRFQHSKIRPVFSGCGRSVIGTLDEIRLGTMKPSDLPPIIVIVGRREFINDGDGDVEGDGEDSNDNADFKIDKGRRSKTRGSGHSSRQKKQSNSSDIGSCSSANNVEYFSLNNRRLWVLKRCREEGLLESTNNKIQVRVREPKSQQERERYSVKNCVLEAKIIPEKRRQQQEQRSVNDSDQESVTNVQDNDTETDKEGNDIVKTTTIDEAGDRYSDDDDDDSESESYDDQYAPSNRFSALGL